MKLLLSPNARGLSRSAALTESLRRPGAAAGFTRWELTAVLATLGLLAGLVAPILANTNRGSEETFCLNNLRLIGRALQVWAQDHGNNLPWRVPTSSGGTQSSGKIGAAWFEFAWVSNELVTPKILVCPGDSETTRVASDWGRGPVGGFIHPNYRGNALSYWIGLDAGYIAGASVSGLELAPDHVVSGDRNLTVDALGVGCSAGINSAVLIRGQPVESITTRWTNGIHAPFGNVLLNDGRVLRTATPGLREAMSRGDENGTVHILMPK